MARTPEQRRNEILRVLKEKDYADFGYLGELFQVSQMTIRRDIERLEKKGMVDRIYGGVKLRTEPSYEATIQERLKTNQREKQAIAKLAAQHIHNGDVIAFDGSTTAIEVSKAIKDRKNLTVITNNISIAIELSTAPDIQTVLLGGFVRNSSLSLVGAVVEQSLRSFYIDKAFISSKALDDEAGLTDFTVAEGEAKKALIQKSNQVYVMVDHTKLGKLSFFQVMNADQIDTIITDQVKPLTAEQKRCIQSFREKGVNVMISKG